MITVYNIRGTNGSGKTTLARSFIIGDPAAPPNRPHIKDSPTVVDLARYPSPTKKDPERKKVVEGYGNRHGLLDVLVVGSYRTACGGLDGVPNFETSFAAIHRAVQIIAQHGNAPHRAVLAEGVLASTVWGSWGDFAARLEAPPFSDTASAQMAFCYLDTPLEVCLARIRERQEKAGKVRDIKEDLVADKIKAIAATRAKAIAAGHVVYDLPHEYAQVVLSQIMLGDEEMQENHRVRA